MVGPRAGEDEDDAGAGNVAAIKEGDLVGKMRVIHFGEGCGAEVKGAFDCGDEFVFAIGFGEFGTFGRGDAGNF